MTDFQDDNLTPIPIPGSGEVELKDEATITVHKGVWRPEPTTSATRAHVIVIRGTEVGSVFPLNKARNVLGREPAADLQITDMGTSRQHAALVRLPDGKFELRDLGSRNGTFVDDQRLTRPHQLANNQHFRLGQTTVLKFLERGDLEAHYAKAMYRAAMTDSLTGAFNRRYLEVRLDSEVAFSRRHNTPLALLLIDLDHFKKVNDRHGHVVGDQVLEEFSSLARNSIRAEDMMARYGGEEFAIVVRLTGNARAEQLGERIRNTVASHLFQADTERIRLTISLGIAVCDGRRIQSALDLITAADRALLRAKANGRNQLMVFDNEFSD